MSNFKLFGKNLRSFSVIVLLASTVITAVLGGYTLGSAAPSQSTDIPVRVEDPIVILQQTSPLSLFPGETKHFNVTVQNIADLNYTIALNFQLNDSAYQFAYVTFSSFTYSVVPGAQVLQCWLSISAEAPPANLMLTVSRRYGAQPSAGPTPTPSATPTPTAPPNQTEPINSTLPPSVVLFGAGAKWASPNGTNALYISWRDNYDAHGLTDGKEWGPWDAVSTMDTWKAEITQVLQQDGFAITYAGDMPENLTGYDLVVIEAFYAIEPRHNTLIRNFVADGGGVVILGGTPCFFSAYCKDRWPYRFGGTDLTSMEDWFGYQNYVNVGGSAYAVSDNPFGTSILADDRLFYTSGYSAASVDAAVNNTQVIARYDVGTPFAFTHEFIAGRVYWQGHIWPY